ncbi:MAG: phosphocholine cytidylyltransferase family protein [Bacilli bacterium]|nr:phosphocholine cytidylyltransferase family protein [Bacilli bacterium]
MELTKKQFEVLVAIEGNTREKYSQRDIAIDTNFSIGLVNKIVTSLLDMELIDLKNRITEKGKQSLEPYRVKRAIFLAAGFGSRMVPITLNTPKPLVKVHGKRIIESLLDAVVAVGIKEIIIVRGYLGEQFEVLLHKYPNIKFVDNEKYNEANNISSAYLVKDMLENAYVLESDLLLSNPNLIRKYEYSSNFLGVPVDRTDDWCFEVKNGIITKQRIGGINCYQMIGISYYTSKDGKQLSKDLEEVYLSPGGKEKYWDQVPLEIKKQNYEMNVRECKSEDIIEIDTFNELKAIDKTYDV